MRLRSPSAHVDGFARNRLPPLETWPVLTLDDPALKVPDRVNCAAWLLDAAVARGHGDRPVLRTHGETWTYRALLDRVDRIARVLTEDLGLVPGNRVLIRSANNPMFVACWLAVAKAGGIVVATMPLLRAGELTAILEAAQVSHALCDRRLLEEMRLAADRSGTCRHVVTFDGSGSPGAGAALEDMAAAKTSAFVARGHRGRRRCAHRLHVRHDWSAQRDHALPPGHPVLDRGGDAFRARCRSGGHLHWLPAAGVHVRIGRACPVSDAARGVHGDAGATPPRHCCWKRSGNSAQQSAGRPPLPTASCSTGWDQRVSPRCGWRSQVERPCRAPPPRRGARQRGSSY